MPRQLRFQFGRPAVRRREDFIVAPQNAASVRRLDAWPHWHAGVLALVGPEGSGKSHLARAWATDVGAQVVAGGAISDLASLGPILVEDAARTVSDETLFHLINAAGADGVTLLLTARAAPKDWVCALPDLRSRLNAMSVAELAAPDDAVLAAILRKLFQDRAIDPADDLIDYLLRRIERSVPSAIAIVERLDEEGAALSREVNRALARRVLEKNSAVT